MGSLTAVGAATTAVASEEGAESYTLDALGRITNVTYPQGDSSGYTYDPSGNRLTWSSSLNGNKSYTYDDADELLSDGTSSYTYDASGNLASSGSSVFSWDYANRLLSATGPGITASYGYDGEDVRTSKLVNGVGTSYLWDSQADEPLLASDGTAGYLSDMAGSELGQLDASNNVAYYLSGSGGISLNNRRYDPNRAQVHPSAVQPLKASCARQRCVPDNVVKEQRRRVSLTGVMRRGSCGKSQTATCDRPS